LKTPVRLALFDIDGARANGVRGIGVTWGFGSIDELRGAGAHAIAHASRELPDLLDFA
jgi:phosphoglycolate phosphatase